MKNSDEDTESTTNNQHYTQNIEPSGVGGWLLLLVTLLMFVWPLVGYINFATIFNSYESTYPVLALDSDWKYFKAAMWWSFAVFSVMSFYAGWLLSTGEDWSAVKIVKIIIWILGPFAYITYTDIIPITFYNTISLGGASGLLGSIVFSLIWTTYLSRSKRIKNTFGCSGDEIDAPETVPTTNTSQTDSTSKVEWAAGIGFVIGMNAAMMGSEPIMEKALFGTLVGGILAAIFGGITYIVTRYILKQSAPTSNNLNTLNSQPSTEDDSPMNSEVANHDVPPDKPESSPSNGTNTSSNNTNSKMSD